MKITRDPLLKACEAFTGHAALRREIHSLLGVLLGCLLALAAVLFLTSCTSGPVVTADKVWMGGSALTKNKGQYARYSGPLGTVEVGTTENDETVIPGKTLNYLGIKAAIAGSVSALRTKETTTRILAKEETSRAATKSAAANEALRIKATPVEVPAATVPTAGFDPATGLNIVP